MGSVVSIGIGVAIFAGVVVIGIIIYCSLVGRRKGSAPPLSLADFEPEHQHDTNVCLAAQNMPISTSFRQYLNFCPYTQPFFLLILLKNINTYFSDFDLED